MIACIVNGGQKVRPFINKAQGPELTKPFIGKHTLELVRAGLRKCVEKEKPAPTGTGKAAKIPGFEIIGKTGSAQIVGLEQHEEYGSEENIPYALRDHAWFVAGVLDHEPKIAMCVLVEHGHHGSSAAAPLAKEVIDFFYAEHGKDKTKVAQGDATQ
jgi:penicillin-binding protein 2